MGNEHSPALGHSVTLSHETEHLKEKRKKVIQILVKSHLSHTKYLGCPLAIESGEAYRKLIFIKPASLSPSGEDLPTPQS